MRRILKTFAKLLLALLLVVAAAGVWYWRSSLPQVDGKLELTGLQAPVEIVRDRDDVPHIFAKNDADAYFALGFVHAQDRLWQMEMNRRIAAGRLSEVLGPGALDTDRFLRTLGVAHNAEAIWSRLGPDSKDALKAYARGVNAFIVSHNQALPPEFHLTGAPMPEPWKPTDSIGWQTMMAWDLGANWTQELLRMRLSQRLTLAQINQFLPPYPGDTQLATRDYTSLYRELAGTTGQLAAVEKIAPPSLVEGMGSNNWVVSGALSESGKPLLANDPHLGLAAPALWYFAHLSAPGLNVIGATLPGIPGVVLGHNDRIAWGFTNTSPDVQDLYVERINPDNPKQYQTPDGWRDFDVRNEVIKVKGKPDVVLEVRNTRHGPVLTGTIPLLAKAPVDAKKYAIAFQWTALREDDLTMQAGLRINWARNWDDFLIAVRDFSSPQQNMVFADVDGNIGFIAPGRVPIRKPENDLKGLAPAPGWDARYDWDGFIPFESLPQQYNPAAQKVVTANQKVVPDDYPYFITSEWTLPYRAKRITDLLDARPKHNLDSFATIQKDVVSLAAQDLLPLMRKAAPQTEDGKAGLAMLANWNGEMLADRPEPLIFNAWAKALSHEIFAGRLGEDLMGDYWELRNVQAGMVNVLKNVDGAAAWCNKDGITPDPQACAHLLNTSLDAAMADLKTCFGKDPHAWRWGEAHQARSEHQPFAKVALLAPFFDINVASPGDTYTVDVGRYNLRDKDKLFTNHHAPSMRALYDLSNLENSRFMHSTGQSGNVLSSHYADFSRRWVNVEYLPMAMQRETVEKDKIGTLVLSP